jgi:hypothetical protein
VAALTSDLSPFWLGIGAVQLNQAVDQLVARVKDSADLVNSLEKV